MSEFPRGQLSKQIRGTRRDIPPSIASGFIAKVWK